MGILSSIIRAAERKADTVASFSTTRSHRGPGEIYLENGYYGIYEAAYGGGATADNAFRLSAFVTCVKIISEDVSSLPLFINQRAGDDIKLDRLHPLYRRLHDEPNPDMTAMQFREAMTARALVHGKAYARQERNGSGDIVALWPMGPEQIREDRDSRGRKVYIERTNGWDGKAYRSDQMFTLTGFSTDGKDGMSPLKYAKDAITLGLTQQDYARKFFEQSQTPPLVLEHPGITDASKVKEAWRKAHEGRWFAPAVLQEGMKVHTLEPDAAKAQLREQREMQLLEICRPFRLSPHKLGDLGRATWANISAQNISHLNECLRPWLVRWEQAINQQLLRDEHPERYAEHEIAGMLRGDFQMQTDGFRSLLAAGVLSINEVRGYMNLNKIEGGDNHFIQINQGTVQDVARGMSDQTGGVVNAGR